MGNNKYSTAIVRNEDGKLETICLDTGEVLDVVGERDLVSFKFNLETASLMCQHIREGRTLKSIGDDVEFPSLQVIHYWRRTNATFDAELKLARKDRAEYYHDKVLDIANTITDKEDIPVARFQTDQYKWAAEKGDPASYGNKIEHSGSNIAPTYVVVTGVPKRKADVETEAKEVENENENTERGREINRSEQGRVHEIGEEESEGTRGQAESGEEA